MSRRNHKTAKGYNNHGTPMTRRDLLAQGALTGGAFAVVPSMLSMFSSQARGAELVCSTNVEGAAKMVPFIIFDLAGGANIAGSNVMVGGPQGQKDYLSDAAYGTIGVGTSATPGKVAPDESLGLAFNARSQMLAGIKGTAGTAIANVDGALFCTASGDDTRNNPHNPLYWIAKAGLGGELVSLIGTADGASGGNAAAPAASIDPSKQPSRISRPADALGLVNPGKLATLLAAGSTPAAASADVQKILNAIKTMSESRLKMFQQQDVPTQIQDLIRCGYINSSDFLSKFAPDNLDPSKDTAITNAFTLTNAQEATAGSIAKLVLDGYAGAGVVQMGGYDYHGQGRPTQDAQDLLAGRMIGKVLAAAAAKNSPVMIYVYTDGGVSSGGGDSASGLLAFANDAGDRSSAFSLVYNPTARPGIRDDRRQIGNFGAGGSVDQAASPISANVTNLGKAIVANYLALHGKEADLEKVVGDNPFGADLEKVLAFKKIV